MKTRIVILAAGKGKRMKSDTPKALEALNGRPLILYVLEAVKKSGVDPHPIIIVGHQSDLVKRELGSGYEYVFQKKQLGTGHAAECAKKALGNGAEGIIVLYADHPFVKPSTITRLVDLHKKERPVISMMTTKLKDFEEWRDVFYEFGRIVRDENGNIDAVIEKKDASPEELEITEVNPAYFCFDATWLWENLKKLKNDNAAHEYYLTDLVHIAIEEGEKIASMTISPLETVGVNTKEHLEVAEGLDT